jgi:DNA-binding response OmpR family regulator
VRILVVEDERKLAQVLASALKAEHYEVVLAPTGEDGFFRANAESFDLVPIRFGPMKSATCKHGSCCIRLNL